jgi:beta-lactamase regulating signal transducer with metallopeptidase domain
MIAASMLYAFAIALLLSCAGLAAERLLVMRRWPTRHVWLGAIIASCLIPGFSLLPSAQSESDSNRMADRIAHAAPIAPGSKSTDPTLQLLGSPVADLLQWPRWPQFDSILTYVWAASSLGMLTFLWIASFRFHRMSRRWPLAQLSGSTVCVTEQFGPAVFGWMTPRVIVPRWLLQTSRTIHSTVMAHEQAHMKAHDPQLILAAQLLVVLAPWNLFLWWQLRRLQFAVEVDCDRRVLGTGLDPVTYAEALLAVGQQRSQIPLGAIALTEPVSQLERRIRIMMSRQSRYSAVFMGGLLALSVAFIASAAQIGAPVRLAAADLRKPPPTGKESMLLGQRFEAVVKQRYPELLSQKIEGTPIVSILFNQNGSVERSTNETIASSPETFMPTEADYAKRFGIKVEEVAYVGVQGMEVPSTGTKILVAFTERKRVGQPFHSAIIKAQVTQEIDRKIAERYFAADLKNGVSSQERLWVLLDSEGNVLKTGKAVPGEDPIDRVLKQQYPGIDTQYVTATPITGGDAKPVNGMDGKPLTLFCVWLKKTSALPNA